MYRGTNPWIHSFKHWISYAKHLSNSVSYISYIVILLHVFNGDMQHIEETCSVRQLVVIIKYQAERIHAYCFPRSRKNMGFHKIVLYEL